MSKATTEDDSTESISTGVYHDGGEVAVRARSKYSRSTHEPITDADGDVVFYAKNSADEAGPIRVVDESHPDAEPRPSCGIPTGDVETIDFMLSKTADVTNRPACSFCTGTNGDPAKGAGKLSAARRLRYGDEWGQK